MPALPSTHLHPNMPVRVSPELSASYTSPYRTAATPSVVSMRNGNVDTDQAVRPPSVIVWYAVDVPSVTAYINFDIPTTFRWCRLTSNTSEAERHTSPTDGTSLQRTEATPEDCSTTTSIMLNQLSTRVPTDRIMELKIRNNGDQSGAHMTVFSNSVYGCAGFLGCSPS